MAQNPFLRPEEEPEVIEEVEHDPILGDHTAARGVGNPRALRNVSPAPGPPAPLITKESVWLVGASGGVGTTTLAKLGGEFVVDGGTEPPMWQAPTYVVAATHAAGLDAAAELARANARGELAYEVKGLVLVHDRPKLSKPTVQRAKAVGGMYPLVMTVSFEASWREPDAVPSESNVRLRRVLKAIRPTTEKKKGTNS